MSTRRSHSRSNKSYDDENSNNNIDPNSLTAFQRLWCVAHTLSWLNVPELARARLVNSTFLEAVDGDYVAPPFVHLVETVERLQEKLLGPQSSPPPGHSHSWLMHRLQALYPKMPFHLNERLNRIDSVAKSRSWTPADYLSSLVKPAIRAADCDDIRAIFVELGASKKVDCDVFEYAARDFAVTELLLDLGIVDSQPARTVGFILNRGGSPALVRRLLESNKHNRDPEQYKKLGHAFHPYHRNDQEHEYSDFEPSDGIQGSLFSFDTIASAAVRRCAFTFRRCRSDSEERKMALENLRMVIDFEREAPWREESNCVQAQRMSFLSEQWQAKLVSPIHVAAANRDYEALEVILNCGFAFGSSPGVNDPGLAGRYVPAGDEHGGFLTQLARSALEHVCFEWSRDDDYTWFEDYDDSVDATHILIPVIKLLVQHGAKWTEWQSCSDNARPQPDYSGLPNPATIVSRDPSEIQLLVTLVTECGCDPDDEANSAHGLRCWVDGAVSESVLKNAIKSGQLAFVKRVVLDCCARLKLPCKLVKRSPSGRRRHRARSDDSDVFETDADQFYRYEKQRSLADACQHDGYSSGPDWTQLRVDRVTGAETVIYDEHYDSEREHAWFLNQLYDLDATPRKRIHSWFRKYIRSLTRAPFSYHRWIRSWRHKEVDEDEEQEEAADEQQEQQRHQQKRQHASSQREEEHEDDNDVESDFGEHECEEEEAADEGNEIEQEEEQVPATTVGAEQPKTSWWDSVKSVFGWRR